MLDHCAGHFSDHFLSVSRLWRIPRIGQRRFFLTGISRPSGLGKAPGSVAGRGRISRLIGEKGHCQEAIVKGPAAGTQYSVLQLQWVAVMGGDAVKRVIGTSLGAAALLGAFSALAQPSQDWV